MTRRALIAGFLALPLARLPESAAAMPDDEPIWDFQIDNGLCRVDEVFVFAQKRQDGPPESWTDEYPYAFTWCKRTLLERMGARMLCDDLMWDQWGSDGHSIGHVTVELWDQMPEVR